jgi:hypothetical protein
VPAQRNVQWVIKVTFAPFKARFVPFKATFVPFKDFQGRSTLGHDFGKMCSKHGDRYLRSLFTVGALTVIRYVRGDVDLPP